jgi:hypothetical protein
MGIRFNALLAQVESTQQQAAPVEPGRESRPLLNVSS